jgi:hypothetical protein
LVFAKAITLYKDSGEKKTPIHFEEDKELEIIFDAKNASKDLSSQCVFWDFDASDWSTEGCRTIDQNESTICRCRHLTNFAVLVSLRHTNEMLFSDAKSDAENLRLITLVGCSASALSLFICLIFFVFQNNSNDRVRINAHFCFSLFAAEILILCGLNEDLGDNYKRFQWFFCKIS